MCEAGSAGRKERQSLANDAIAIAAPINEGWGPSGLKEERISDDPDGSRKALLQELGNQKYVDWRVPRWTANLLVAGLCDQKVFLKPWDFGLSWLREDLADMPERLLQILLARKPKWLTGWLEKEWKQEKPIPNGYVEEGLIQSRLDRCAAERRPSEPAWRRHDGSLSVRCVENRQVPGAATHDQAEIRIGSRVVGAKDLVNF